MDLRKEIPSKNVSVKQTNDMTKTNRNPPSLKSILKELSRSHQDMAKGKGDRRNSPFFPLGRVGKAFAKQKNVFK